MKSEFEGIWVREHVFSFSGLARSFILESTEITEFSSVLSEPCILLSLFCLCLLAAALM